VAVDGFVRHLGFVIRMFGLVLLEWPFIPCYSHIHSKYDFWHDFAGKSVLNVLGGVVAVLEL